jgi:hypothetical protein
MTFELDPNYRKKRIQELEGGSTSPAKKVIDGESQKVERLNRLFGTNRLLGAILEEDPNTETSKDLNKERESIKRELKEIMSDFRKRGIKIRRATK